MHPRRSERHPWRDDHLGGTLRGGLESTQKATPSSEVWNRIAREIAPAEKRGLSAFTGGDRSDSPADSPSRRFGYGHASLASAMLLVYLVAFGNLVSLVDGVDTGPCRSLMQRDCSWDRLSHDEIEIQPVERAGGMDAYSGWTFRVEAAPRIDREARLARLFAGREAYNRSEWLPTSPGPGTGSGAVIPETQRSWLVLY